MEQKRECTDKCVKLVCAITDLEEITKTIKRTQQMKTFSRTSEHCEDEHKKEKKAADTVMQHMRMQCTRNQCVSTEQV